MSEIEEQLGALREQLRALQAENEQLKLPVSNPPAATFRVDRTVYIPWERRCPKFYGHQDSPDSVDLEDCIEEVDACLEGRHLLDKEKAIFPLDHLGGEPRSEIKHHPSRERENPYMVISILKALFSGKKPLVVLQQCFL